jgi:O-antigen/teichoic acid export membrane protein
MRLRALSIAGGYMLGVYGAVAAIGVVSIRLLTELAPPAVFGEANLLLTVLGLAVTTAFQPFTNTQLRYHSAAADAGLGDAFTRETLLWTAAAGAGVSVLAAIAWAALRAAHATQLGLTGLLGAIGLVFATGGRNVIYGRLQAERRNLRYGGLLVAEAAVVAAGAALGLWVSATVDGYVIGAAAGMVGAALLGFSFAPGGVRGLLTEARRPPDFLSQVRAYGLPFAPIGVLSWLANLADRYVLGALMGAAAAGRYVAPFSIASRGMSLFSGALGDLLRPALFAAVNRGDEAGSRSIFWGWVAARTLAAAGGLIGLALFGPLIVRLLLAPGYRQGALPIMMWVAAAYGVQGVIQTLETRLMSLERTSWLILPLAIGGVSNLAFSLLLIPRGGAVGAGQATAASFAVQAVVTLYLLRLTRAPVAAVPV